jgi:imidazolonepropionase
VTIDLVVRNASRLLTCSSVHGEGALGVIEGGALAASLGKITWIGPERDLPAHEGARVVDAGGGAVLPGLIDPHTHLIWAGDRGDEFVARIGGDAYTGGGIARTVEATSAASDDALRALAMARLDRFAAFGVTTIEAKSGYGLSRPEESRLVQLAATMKHPVTHVVPTFLGAHTVPAGVSAADAEREVIDTIPEVATRAVFIDAWCERGAFDVEACERILRAGAAAGMQTKLHAEQLSRSGGAQLAARLGCRSVDHLEHATEEDARALADAGVVAVLMPGASMMTGQPFAPARILIDAGVTVSLSTDCNPGSSYSENLPLQVALACTQLEMTLPEAILGVTAHAAAATDLLPISGVLVPGAFADVVILEAPHEAELAYHYGASLVKQVISARPS